MYMAIPSSDDVMPHNNTMKPLSINQQLQKDKQVGSYKHTANWIDYAMQL
jgi:hypothetical protein